MYVCVCVCVCTGRTVEAKAEHVTDAKQYIKSEGLGDCHSFSGCMGRYTRISAYPTITICLYEYTWLPIRVSAYPSMSLYEYLPVSTHALVL